MGTIHEADERQHRLATEWHGGQSSMLYAVSSTGALSTGTHRPHWSDGEPMTDSEWERDLAGRLAAELQEVETLAGANYSATDDPEAADDHDIAMFWRLEMITIANADAEELSNDSGRANLTTATALLAVAGIGATFVGSWVAQAAAMLGGVG